MRDGLYSTDPSDKATPVGHVHVVDTVTRNEAGFTARQKQRAKEARCLYHVTGAPTLENFKHLLRTNMIGNCPVTCEDVDLAEEIYGPDAGLYGVSRNR